jgi:hypothetical protein
MATWNREQAATQRLLANSFEDPKWRTTALKNAYALMSKRRFGKLCEAAARPARRRFPNERATPEYAAAFFLLADQLHDAVNVCLNQLKDLQLAIAVARVYEGDDRGPVLRKLLEEEVLAIAAREGNRWLASWAFWMLRRRDMAVRALIVSSPWTAKRQGPRANACCPADASLHSPRDALLAGPQVQAVPDG